VENITVLCDFLVIMVYYSINKNCGTTEMKPTNPFLARIMPYFVIALMIVVFIISLFVFSYVLIFAVILGLILFVVGYIRTKFFTKKNNNASHESFFIIQTHTRDSSQNKGRVIEHNEDEKR